jgi:hypothetical protein
VLAQASIGRIGGPGAIAPGIAHHVPLVVIGRAVVTGRVGQTEPMAHLVRQDGLVTISPGRLPGCVPEAALPIECGPAASAPGGAVEFAVEHQVDADIGAEVDGRVRRTGTIAEELGEHARTAEPDVVRARLREGIPTDRTAADNVDGVVGSLPPVVVEPRPRPSNKAVEVGERLGLRGDVRELAQDVDPRLRPRNGLSFGARRRLSRPEGGVQRQRFHAQQPPGAGWKLPSSPHDDPPVI